MRSSLLKLSGVKKADVNWDKGEAKVIYNPQKAGVEQLAEAIIKAGFSVKSAQ